MAGDGRPDPDALLATIERDAVRARRGRLRIFFGACAGVGKTYAMLEAARAARAAGTDLVVGYVEPHGRAETERLLEGLESLPPLHIHYRGIVRREFDLDAALHRRAAITLVDELAHSNPTEGSPRPRHGKRWQDVEELLSAGMNVWTTLNVQHLESLNDLVANISGVRQRETIPDRVFDEADTIELIDLPPDDLLARLRAGKVYVPEQAGMALDRFFMLPNLNALRELALRRTADRVDAAARALRLADGPSRPWLARDRLLVCIGPDAQAEQLVRAGKRLADALDAEWTVVYVETPALQRLGAAERDRRIEVLRLAESLGGETVTLDGRSPAGTVLEYAQTRKATRLLVGEPRQRGWKSWLRPSTSTELVRRARGVDVVVVAWQEAGAARRPRTPPVFETQEIRWRRYGWALGITAVATAIASLMYPYFELTNVVMVYLLGCTIAGLRLGREPSILAAVASVAAFDFFFVAPHFTFAVADFQYLITFAVMLLVALIIASLTASVRQQTRVAGARERRTALLYAMSRELAATRGLENMARVAVKHVAEVFDSRAAVLLPAADGRLRHPAGIALPGSLVGADLSVAQWVLDQGRPAGLGTDTLPGTPAVYLPLTGSRRAQGVLAVLPDNQRRVLLPEQRHLLDTFAGQIALAIERAQLAVAAEHARVAAETEGVRNTLLASISHDLRTPLAALAGAGSVLFRHGDELDAATRTSLARTIETKASEMSDLISNVLELTRLESTHVELRRDWQTLDDLVGTALARVRDRAGQHHFVVDLPPELPSIVADGTLLLQLFVNLFDNAIKHTPPGTHVYVTAAASAESVLVVVEDDGPGLPGDDPRKLFDKFHRGNDEGAMTGVGLGLAICRAIACAHGGDITAGIGSKGGARFEIRLPLAEGGT